MTLGPATTLTEVESLASGESALVAPNHHIIRIPPFTCEGRLIACTAYFTFEKLIQLGLAVAESRYGESWKDATEEKERLRAEDTEKWLRGLGYPPGDYPWGSVWVGFDLKGFSGGAVISYHAESLASFPPV